MIFGGQPAAGRAQGGDVVEQPVLCLRRQVHQQALRAPRRRLCHVKTVGAQCFRPVLAQVDADRAQLRGRAGAQRRHGVGLELHHLGLVDLVHHGAGRPVQPVGTGVQPGGQDHRLADPVPGGAGEEVVEKAGAHRDRIRLQLQVAFAALRIRGRHLAVDQAAEEIQPDRPHQRRGERVVDDRALARAGQRPGRGHHRRRRAHARGQVPTVLVGACHAAPKLLSKCNDSSALYAPRLTASWKGPDRTRPDQLLVSYTV